MKKYLIVGDNSTIAGEPERIAAFKEFLAGSLDAGAQLDAIFYDEIVFSLSQTGFSAVAPVKQTDLRNYQAIFMRGKRFQEYFIARFCAKYDIPCINDYSIFYPGTKFAQTVIFHEEGVPFLPTSYCANQKLLTEHAAEQFGYPYILKANKASHGDSNYLIKTAAEAQAALTMEPNADFLAMEFCENECDYRLLLMGDDALLFERRGGADTHLNNTSKGGVAKAMDLETLPQTIRDQAKSLAKRFGLHIAGLDVIPRLGTDEYYFLEVNLQPQLRTGALVPEKQAILRKLFASF